MLMILFAIKESFLRLSKLGNAESFVDCREVGFDVVDSRGNRWLREKLQFEWILKQLQTFLVEVK